MYSFGGGGSLIRIKDAKDEVKWFFEVETIPRERTTFLWLLPSGEEVCTVYDSSWDTTCEENLLLAPAQW